MIVAQFVKDLFVATATPFRPESNVFFSASVLLLYFCIFLMGYFVFVRKLFFFVATATPFHPESNLFVSVSVLSLYFCIFVFSVLMVFLYQSGNHLCLLQLRLCSVLNPIYFFLYLFYCFIIVFSFLMGTLYLSGNYLCLLQLGLWSALDPI